MSSRAYCQLFLKVRITEFSVVSCMEFPFVLLSTHLLRSEPNFAKSYYLVDKKDHFCQSLFVDKWLHLNELLFFDFDHYFTMNLHKGSLETPVDKKDPFCPPNSRFWFTS